MRVATGEKFRPLELMHVVFGLDAGGLENGVVNICNRLDPALFHSTICVFRGGGALESRLDADRVELLQATRHGNYDPTLPFRLAWHLRQRRIDILHTHNWGTLIEGITAAKLARTPIIVHGEHGVLETQRRRMWIQRALWPRAHQVTTVAAQLADRMDSEVGFPRNRIRVIRNGVDTERFHPRHDARDELRQQFGLPTTGFLIGMVARLAAEKNHLGVLHALARLRDNGLPALLALAGDGPLRSDLEQAARDLMLTDHMYFLGNIRNVDHFLNALDAFVLNSHTEGMSNTVLEAMACGLPVVATSVGDNPDLVADGHSGHLIPSDDVDALCGALATLAGDASRREAMGRAGRQRVEQSFSIDRMVRGYVDLYQTLMARRLGCSQPCPDIASTAAPPLHPE